MTDAQTMTALERAKLLDAVMRSTAPEAYARGVHGTFSAAGRGGDALVAAMIAELHHSGEIEFLMRLWAEWTGGSEVVQPPPARPR